MFLKGELAPAPSTDNSNAYQTGNDLQTKNTDSQNNLSVEACNVRVIRTFIHVICICYSPSQPLSSFSGKRTSIKEMILEIERKKLILTEQRMKESNLKKMRIIYFSEALLSLMKELTNF